MSDTEYWNKVESLIDKALLLNKKERSVFLRKECEDDKNLYRDATDFLNSIEQAENDNFLEGGLQSHFELIREYSESNSFNQPPDLIGRTIGSYKLIEILGEGGMGAVYLAERTDGEFEKLVAIKFLKHGLFSPMMRDRFRLEKVILSRLDHPGIARLYDGGVTDDGTPYLVMEYVKGLPVDQYCNDRNLSIEERIAIFKKICDTVQYAHSHLIIHRDLKPKNIYITEAGEVKILDFGIAKLLTADIDEWAHLQTGQGQFLLSLQHAAPEQITGGEPSAATDVYVLGILLYKLLTGTFPFIFKQKTRKEAEQIIQTEIPVKPNRIQNKDIGYISEDLSSIIMKALRKEPGERYQTVFELSGDINRYIENLPVFARKGGLQYKTKKYVQRNKLPLTVTLLILFISGGFGVYHLNQINQQKMIAQNEAITAQLVTDYMIDLFASANPLQNIQDTLTVYDLLQRGVEKIDEIQGQPVVQLNLLTAIGNSYLNLSDYNSAAHLLHRADSLANILYPQNSFETANSSLHLASLYASMRDFKTAVPYYKKSLAYFNESSKENIQKRAIALSGLGDSYLETGKSDSSITLLHEALQISNRNTDLYLSILVKQAKAYRSAGNFSEAEKIYLEIIDASQNTRHINYKILPGTLNNLAFLLKTQNRLEEAKMYYEKALDLHTLVYGEKHSNTAIILTNLASTTMLLGELEYSEHLIKKNIEIKVETTGETSWQTGSAYSGIARFYLETGRHEKATEAFTEALRIYHLALGPEHTWTAINHLYLDFSLELAGLDNTPDNHYNKGVAILNNRMPNLSYNDRENFNHLLTIITEYDNGNYSSKLNHLKSMVLQANMVND